jgi:hypothetical protein
MLDNMIVIEGEQVDFLKAIPGVLNYNPTKTDEKTGEIVPNEDSPLFGKQYRRFAYGDKVFIANTEDEFCKLYDDEQLWKVVFTTNDQDQYTLVKGVSIKRTLATANTSAEIKKIYKEAEATPVSANLLDALKG